MKVAVVCANGKAGSLITREAVARGMDVTAFVRGTNKSAAQKAVIKDVFDLTRQDLEGFDVVIDAFGAWTAETIPLIPKAAEHLASLVEGTPTRLIVVGGAGSLFTDETRKMTLEDSPSFPPDWVPLSKAHGKGLAFLRAAKDVKWTYVSPAADFQAEGARTGGYKLSGDVMAVNSEGKSVVSYADYAIAIVDEAVSGKHVCERISIVGRCIE